MFALVQNNQFIRFIPIGSAFTIGDVNYPADWFFRSTPSEKAVIGIIDVVYANRPDDRYYWVTENAPVYADNVVTVTFSEMPKDLVMLKDNATSQINDAAWQILHTTDYMDSRKSNDPSYTPPADWLVWRSAIRNQAKVALTAIAEATDIPSLITASSVNWDLNPVSSAKNQTIVTPSAA